jgi:hypothetical protein
MGLGLPPPTLWSNTCIGLGTSALIARCATARRSHGRPGCTCDQRRGRRHAVATIVGRAGQLSTAPFRRSQPLRLGGASPRASAPIHGRTVSMVQLPRTRLLVVAAALSRLDRDAPARASRRRKDRRLVKHHRRRAAPRGRRVARRCTRIVALVPASGVEAAMAGGRGFGDARAACRRRPGGRGSGDAA